MIKFLKLNYLAVLLLSASTFFVSCDESTPEPEVAAVGTEGYFIVNEGGWGNGNTSLSFYDRTTATVTNDLFYDANSERALGDQAQSMAIHNNIGYIVVQNSGTIEVVDIDSVKSIATISEGIESPRYFAGLSKTKGYVSDWGVDGFTGTVKVLDLTTNTVTKTIPTGQGANHMLISQNMLYVVNNGGWGRDNTLVIIDTNTDEVTETVEIADNPNSLQIDADGNIWVLSSGYSAYNQNYEFVPEESTYGTLTKINSDGDELLVLSFTEFSSPSLLNVSNDGQTLYFKYASAIYKMDIIDQTLPTEVFINKSYYGLAIDPIDDTIIGCDASLGFSVSGSIDIYDKLGVLKSTHGAGIAPNSCTFK